MHITDEDIKKLCSATVYNRAKEYFEKGRTHIKKRDENELTASVDDDKIYNTRISFKDNAISDIFCTCAYFETMGSPCKHIAATLMQRMAEQNRLPLKNENNVLCRRLCECFHKDTDEKRLPVHFDIYINSIAPSRCSYSVSIKLEDKPVQNTFGFLEAYTSGEYWDYRKKRTGSVPPYYIEESDKAVLNILAEFYQNMAVFDINPKSPSLFIGAGSFERIINLIEKCSYTIFFNRINLGRILFLHENPDILIDISANDTEISLYAGSYGTAVVPNGSIFYYENNIYITDKQWQKWFMPIYNSLCADFRTQLSFTRDTAVDFAKYILPAIKGKPGVISHGLDESVVNTSPVFTIYLDSTPNYISCVVKVTYGELSFTLPINDEIDSKIVVRDKNAEEYILWQLSDFTYSDGKYILSDNEMIFTFLTKLLPELSKHTEVFLSQSIKNIIPKKHTFRHRISYNKKINLLESDIESDMPADEIRELLRAVSLKRSFHRMKNGEFIDISDERSEISVINGLYGALNDSMSNLGIQKHGIMYLMGIANSSQNIKLSEDAAKYIENIKNIKEDIPKSLSKILRNYQKDGINRLKQLSTMGLGGILADDMGLGKTLQIIAYIYSEKPEKPVLIVCPSSLTYNWQNEINKFTPSVKSLIIDGSAVLRKKLIDSVSEYEFVITSYSMLRRDITDYAETEFSYCIIDEAQNIKNAKSLNSKCVKSIHSDYKIALTGTPIENSLSELWSLFDFCNPGYLGDYKEFRTEYEIPVMNGFPEASMMLRRKTGPFIIRRMKSEVLNELPEKIENTMLVNMTEEQGKLYHSFRALAKRHAQSILSSDEKNKSMEILTLLLRLRQICCHPSVFDNAYKYGSGKLDLLSEITENAVSGGHRILIFSQFTSMLEIIQKTLSEKNISCFYLDGQTPPHERTKYAERFNGGEKSVFLISLKAGGTGLNLTGADMVIHYDPWWNPAVTDQASDRAYRIGQKKSVQIIKLASKNTIEEKILSLQEQKRAIADDIIRSDSLSLKNMSADEIIQLFE